MACLDSTRPEFINFARLCRALVDLSTNVLREVLGRQIKPLELKKRLRKSSEFNFKDLAKIDKSAKEDDYRDFDISLLYKLLVVLSQQKQRDELQKHIRPSKILETVMHCHGLTVNPVTKLTTTELNMVQQAAIADSYDELNDQLLHKLFIHLCGGKNGNLIYPTKPWGQTPNPDDVTIGDDVERIRIMRNKIVHIPSMNISDVEFNELWTDLEHILLRIDRYLKTNYKTDLAKIKSEVIDENLEKRYLGDIKNMLNNEREVEMALTNAHHGNRYETCLEVDSWEDSGIQSQEELKTDHKGKKINKFV